MKPFAPPCESNIDLDDFGRIAPEGMYDGIGIYPHLHITSGSDDGTIRIWGAETGTAVGNPLRGTLAKSVAFSSDGQHIVSGSRDGTTHVWDSFPYLSIQPSSCNPSILLFVQCPMWMVRVRDSEGGLLCWVPHDIRTSAKPAVPPICTHIRDHQRDIPDVYQKLDSAQCINVDAGIQRDLRCD